MTKTIGYARGSTDKQEITCPAQAERIRAMATMQGITLDEIVQDEGWSAKNLDRPGIKRVLEMITSGEVKAVIVAKLDRITRSVRDLYYLLELFQKHGARLISVNESLDTDTASGRLVIGMLGVVSQWHREVIAENTRDALRELKRTGKRAGTCPYGYHADAEGRLIEDENEMAIRLFVISLYEQDKTMREISGTLNGIGYTTRTGGLWTPQGVNHILKTGGQSK